MVKANKPQAKFIWRKTLHAHVELYTLMDWENVQYYGYLPPEYTNHFGAKFWDAGSGRISIDGCTTDKSYQRTGLEKAEYEAVVAHLRAASKRLRSVNQAIKESGECVTIEVSLTKIGKRRLCQ